MNREQLRTAGVAVLVGALLAALFQGGRSMDEARKELAKLRTEKLEAEAAAAGWETRFVERTRNLEAELEDAVARGDTLAAEKAELAREVEALGANLTALVDMYATARNTIVAAAERPGAATTASPDSAAAELDDGLLRGRVAFAFASQAFRLDYAVSVGLVLGWAEAPDGRALAVARPVDDRVAVTFGPAYYDPPARPAMCTFGQKAKVGLFTLAGREAADLLFRIIG